MTTNETADLLEEIAQVMRERPDRWWREFEQRVTSQSGAITEWRGSLSGNNILIALGDSYKEVRRRPRTVRVCGEVHEEVRDVANWVLNVRPQDGQGCCLARALLDLIDGGE